MQAIAQKFAMQAALVGSISAGSYVIRKFKKIETNEIIKDTTYLKEQPELCYVLNGIYCLRNDEIFRLIVKKLEELLSSIRSKKDVWSINRNITDVINLANLMKKKAVQTFDEELITFAIDYEKEYYPSLKRQLDDILHNMLLDRIKN
tara:strand:- start:311 stop:754 length:444 start_codon:yes stop_codon:yes gene_type:complete